jgi:acyl-CoA dehydrogenase
MTPEERLLLLETAEKFFAAEPADFAAAWPQTAALGLPDLLVGEDAGGFGGGWSGLYAVQQIAGRFASALPIGEAAAANWICRRANLAPGIGFGSVAGTMTGSISEGRFTGRFARVPGAAKAAWIVGLDEAGGIVRLDTAGGTVTPFGNIAGEDRGSWRFEDAPCETGPCNLDPALLFALIRLGNIAGALEAVLLLTSEHARTRVQFGKAIAQFQTTQQQLALFAGEVGAAGCAGEAACASADRLGADGAGYAIAAAKLRANLAIESATAIAHQLHGAIGFTQEHRLHRYTKRLWAWRTEGGNDRYWASRLGAAISGRGAARLWPDIVEA